MLCYAWNRFREGAELTRGSEESPDLPNLFGRVLARGIKRLRKRGFAYGYTPRTEITSQPRGRILFSASLKDQSLLLARAHCEFDNFEMDVLPNQILKATVVQLLSGSGLAPDVKDELREGEALLRFVSLKRITDTSFLQVQYHRSHRLYGFLLQLCQMIASQLLVNETAGRYHFPDLTRDDRFMAVLFEEFVRNFYREEQNEFDVSRDRIRWITEASSHTAYLPMMETDISLRSLQRTIIIDCKYYREALVSHYESESVRSGHLYQLFAYLSNLSARESPHQLEGVLLYPQTTKSLHLHFRLHQFPCRIYTINLEQDWIGIKVDLLGLLRESSK